MDASELIDTHVHFWDTTHLPYPWLQPIETLNRPHGPEEYWASLGKPPAACVWVQANVADGREAEERAWVASLRETFPALQGLVAGARVEQGEVVEEELRGHLETDAVKGIRRGIPFDRSAPDAIADAFVAGVGACAEHKLSFDVLIRHEQLPAATALAQRCPFVFFVLDHLGKPPIASGAIEPWNRDLAAFAALPNTAAKISGLITEADRENWRPEDLRPYVDHAVACFGTQRLMFGSDWPVVKLAGGLTAWLEALETLLAGWSAPARAALLSENARRIYRLP
jgi:L-fuconolactonase